MATWRSFHYTCVLESGPDGSLRAPLTPVTERSFLLGPKPTLLVRDGAIRIDANPEDRRRFWHRGNRRNDLAVAKSAVHGVPPIFELLARPRDRLIVEMTQCPSWRAVLFRDPHMLLAMGDVTHDLATQGLKMLPGKGALVAGSDPSRPQRIALGERVVVGEWMVQVDDYPDYLPEARPGGHSPLITAIRAELLSDPEQAASFLDTDARISWDIEEW